MKAYRTSVKIKLGLIAAAVAIAVASLAYTNALADRLMRQEQEAVRVWVRAIEYQATAALGNPHYETFDALAAAAEAGALPPGLARDSLREAVAWAQEMPPADALDFVFNEIIEPARFSVPAIITDSSMTLVTSARHVRVDSSGGEAAVQAALLDLARRMDETHEPIRFAYAGGDVQLVHYGESSLARLIRWFPTVQLLFVALFIGVGYLGFSYVRRNEQSSLWVGMAKEAAHQLGTPISSMIGWIELLRLQDDDPQAAMVADELEQDVDRLRLVADRFSKIGSTPELRPMPLAPVVEHVSDYIRRRAPREGQPVSIDVFVPRDLAVALNPELFQWVVENLLKNALDAMEGRGQITVEARAERDEVVLEVSDTGKGMDRQTARHIFRPGFTTKKRGWGLGLSLAKRIVEDYHGGRLELAHSKPGEGTTFAIRLPATALPAGDGRAGASPAVDRPAVAR